MSAMSVFLSLIRFLHLLRIKIVLRPLYESVAKEKWTKILLFEAENEANNGLLAIFPRKSSEILVISTRHLIRAKVSFINC
jgi:hypothetical protein